MQAQSTNLDASEHQRIDTHGAGKTEVTQFDNAAFAQQNILWLHVSVQNAVSVEIEQC